MYPPPSDHRNVWLRYELAELRAELFQQADLVVAEMEVLLPHSLFEAQRSVSGTAESTDRH